MLAPLPYLLAFEVPLLTRVPVALMLQVAAPTFVGSLAMITAARMLSAGDRTIGLVESWRDVPKGAALAAAATAALVAVLVIQVFGLIVLLLMNGFVGPPLVAQVIGVEKPPYRRALQRVGEIATGRTWLYLLNVVVATGLVGTVALGGFGVGTLDAPGVIRAVVGPLFQAAAMGLLVGFLAAFEYELFEDRRAATAADATPD